MKITISGIGGVGKGTISNLLSKELNFKLLSGGNFFRKKAEEYGKNLYEFNEYVKKHPEIDIELDKMQEEFGKNNDKFILESRLGWYFIPDSFKIQLTCEENERLRRIQERDGGSIEEITEKEKKRLNDINFRYKKIYNIENFQDPKHFDLIIDTTNLKPEEITKIILDKIKPNLK